MNSLSRRTFLAGLVFSAIGSLPLAGTSLLEDLGDQEFGEAVPYVCGGMVDGVSERSLVADVLISRAQKALPRGAAFELRSEAPSDFGRRCVMVWYSDVGVRSPIQRDAFVLDRPFDPGAIEWSWMEEGYYYGGRYIVWN